MFTYFRFKKQQQNLKQKQTKNPTNKQTNPPFNKTRPFIQTNFGALHVGGDRDKFALIFSFVFSEI